VAVVVSALCVDFEPEARRYTKSGHRQPDAMLDSPETEYEICFGNLGKQ
jgi:hypothetical protein